jgi:hypothetical protein
MRLEVKTLLIVGKSSEAVPRLVLGRGLRSQKSGSQGTVNETGLNLLPLEDYCQEFLVLLLAFVQHAQGVEDEIGIAECLNSSRKLLAGLLELERSAGYFDYLLKAEIAALTATGGIHDATVIELHLAFKLFVSEGQNAVQPCVFNYLNRVEDADGTEISGESEVFAFEVRFRSGRRLEIRATRPPNGFEPGCNVYPTIELFCFKQPVVGSIEVFSFDVDTCEGQTLASSLFFVLVNGANLAELFSQFNGPTVQFDGGPKAFNGLFRRLVLHKELGIEQSCFDLADVLGL